jgi:hypothetical protein
MHVHQHWPLNVVIARPNIQEQAIFATYCCGTLWLYAIRSKRQRVADA